MQDLPVAVDLTGALGEEVAGWVEEIGWQRVELGGGLAPALVLAEAPLPGVPTVVVVAGSPTAAAVRSALQGGAVDVVGWPEDRARLAQVPTVRAARGAGEAGARVLALAGSGGGTGTSTVALATAALLAWSGRRVLAVGDEDLLVLCGVDPWRGPGAAELALLGPEGAAEEVSALARAVPGVPGLAVLGGGAGQLSAAAVMGWPVDAVVLDLRADGGDRADVVCARPDAHLGAAADLPGGVLLVGDGPLDAAQVRGALGRPPLGAVPVSARVARAGALGRVPSALPGSWLKVLRTVLTRLA